MALERTHLRPGNVLAWASEAYTNCKIAILA